MDAREAAARTAASIVPPDSSRSSTNVSRKRTTSVFRSGWRSLTWSAPRRRAPVDPPQSVPRRERADVGELDPLPLGRGDLVPDVDLCLEWRQERPPPLHTRG